MEPGKAQEGLRRVIGFWDAAALVVGLIIGSGIFRAPASVAQYLPTAGLMLSAWVIGGMLSLAGCLAAVELGIRYPRSGGQYVFLREAFGPSVAFAFGWTSVLISKPSVLAGIATVFAIYFSGLVGLPSGSHKTLALGALALLTFVNCLGVKSGTRTQNVLTAAKAAGLGLLGVAAFGSCRGSWSHFFETPGPFLPPLARVSPAAGPHAAQIAHGLPIALALGLVTILYTYDGWIDVTYVGGEVVQPRRVLPRAILMGTSTCVGLYLLVNCAYIYLLSPSEMPRHENIAAVALRRAFGPAGDAALSLLVVTSTLGILNGSILTGVRVPYAMSRDGMLFRFLGRVHPRTLSPVNALIAQGGLSCLVVLFASGFDEIASLFVSTSWLFYAVSLLGLLVLQRREAAARDRGDALSPADQGERSPRIPFSSTAAILFILVTVFIIGADLVFSGWRVLAGIGIVAAGIPVYLLWSRFRAEAITE